VSTAREETIDFGGLRAIAVGDADTAQLVMVLAHGFQMEPADLSPFAHSLQLPVYFVFPEAPLPAEPRGRAWWHIDHKLRDEALKRGPRDFAVQHPPDLPTARATLLRVLEAARALAGRRPLVAGGFSQGGMLTCDVLLRSSLAVEAVALLSASRIAFDEWEPLLTGDRLRGLPTLVSHGETDADLAFAAGEALRDAVAAAGADVTWVPFAQGHEVPLVVWRRLRKLLAGLIATSSAPR
jgi:phospholipase/carboxylesterase